MSFVLNNIITLNKNNKDKKGVNLCRIEKDSKNYYIEDENRKRLLNIQNLRDVHLLCEKGTSYITNISVLKQAKRINSSYYICNKDWKRINNFKHTYSHYGASLNSFRIEKMEDLDKWLAMLSLLGKKFKILDSTTYYVLILIENNLILVSYSLAIHQLL